MITTLRRLLRYVDIRSTCPPLTEEEEILQRKRAVLAYVEVAKARACAQAGNGSEVKQ